MDWGFVISTALKGAISTEAMVFILAAIGLNLHFGYTGLLNFGQAAFVGVGAYAIGVSVQLYGLSLWLGVFLGLMASVVLALLLGIPTLRLRADYLAIVTIAAAEIFRLTVRSASLREYTGGSDGLNGFTQDFHAINPFPTNFTWNVGTITVGQQETWVMVVGWGLIALFTFLIWVLSKSPWGRVLKAIREDEDAVRSLGKNVYSYKMQSLIIGGLIATFGGFIYALGKSAVQPDDYATLLTFYAYTVLILGGAARTFGPIAGGVLFWVVLQLTESVLREAIGAGYISRSILDTTQLGQIRFILMGVALMLLMIYRPQGIFGDRKELALDGR